MIDIFIQSVIIQLTSTKKVKAPKEKKVTRQELILKALMLKSVTSVDKAVEKVLEWRPEPQAKHKDIKVHVNWTVAKLKKPAGKFVNYKFNPETFELTLKE